VLPKLPKSFLRTMRKFSITPFSVKRQSSTIMPSQPSFASTLTKPSSFISRVPNKRGRNRGQSRFLLLDRKRNGHSHWCHQFRRVGCCCQCRQSSWGKHRHHVQVPKPLLIVRPLRKATSCCHPNRAPTGPRRQQCGHWLTTSSLPTLTKQKRN